MAYTTINKSSLNFNTVTWTGNNTARSITDVGFQPDFTWIKSRTQSYDHALFDVIRGATKMIESNTNVAESTEAQTLKSFASNGFSIGTSNLVNQNSQNHVAWNWKAGTTGSGNTGGSGSYKAYSYSVNTTAGFSIVKYLGNGTSGHTIPHHLGSVPAMIIFKQLNASRGWGVYHQSRGAGKILYLDESIAEQSATFLTATPTSSVISLATLNENNINDASYVAYCFAEKTGYSKFGSYIGNGNANGTFVYTGFKPAYITLKRSSGTSDWHHFDNKRAGFNGDNDYLKLNASETEGTSGDRIDILSNGFKLRYATGNLNENGSTFIYNAFAEAPLVGTNNVPCTAR